MDFNNLYIDEDSPKIIKIKELSVVMRAVEAVLELRNKEKQEGLNVQDSETLKKYEKGFTELVLQAVLGIKFTNLD